MRIVTPYFAVSLGKMKKYERMHGHKRHTFSLIFGTVLEQIENKGSRYVTGFNFIPRSRRHRVATNGNTYALSFSIGALT